MKIAIIGPPGAGKTTLAAGLFYHLKRMGKKVEYVPELVKRKVYEGEDFTEVGFDIHNNLEQRKLEKVFDNADPPLEYIIIEAPLCNGYFYSSYYNKEEETPVLKKIAKNTINSYDLIIKLELDISKDGYESHGRLESFDESKKLNDHIFSEFKKIGYKNKTLKYKAREDILGLISEILESEK